MRRAATTLLAVAASCAAVVTGAALCSGAAAAAPAVIAPATGHFTAVTPVRALDTRSAIGVKTRTPVGADHIVTFSVASLVPSDATSIVLNVTATGGAHSGFVTAYAAGSAKPGVSNVNYAARQTIANLATVGIGTGKYAGMVTLYNGSAGSEDLVADVSGYFAPGGTDQGAFAQVQPTRVLDTRAGTGAAKRAVGAHGSVALKIATGSLVPAGASAVVLNVTATAATASGFVTAYPTGSALPTSSNVNFVRGSTVADLVVVPIGDSSSISLYNGSGGSAQFVADVQGYLAGGDPTTVGGLGALTPNRLLDTRKTSAVPGRGKTTLNVFGRGGVPAAEVSSVVLTVTVAQPAAAGFLTVYGGSASTKVPTASNVNFVGGQIVPNSVVVHPDSSGQVTVYNGSYKATQVLIDVAGYGLGTNLTVPATTASHYTTTADDPNSTTLASEGAADAASGASLVLLDVGAQSISSPGLSPTNRGVVLARRTPRAPVTYSALVTALGKYVAAFRDATTATRPRIAIGTNSDGTFTGTGAYYPSTRGRDWATKVIAPLQTLAGTKVTIVGANDIEAGFAAQESSVQTWESYFLANTTAGLIFNGSADACPDTYGATAECQPVKSSTGAHPWTRANYVSLTKGTGANAGRITVLPQIYFANDANQAAQWANINATSKDTLTFEGALSQYPICNNVSCGYTGSEAWAALHHALSTQGTAQALNVATELHPT